MPRRRPQRSASTGSIGSANGDTAGSNGGGGGGRRGVGRRSNSSRPRTGAKSSEQDLLRVIQQCEAQLMVAVQVGAGAELMAVVEEFGEKCSGVEGPSVRIPLLECGIRDWQRLVACQRIIAQLQRPQLSADGEDGLKAETKVQQDRNHREASYLALVLSRESEDQLWKFVNELRLRLESAGVVSRPLLAVGQPILVRLTASAPRRSQQQSSRKSSQWVGNLAWDRIVVSSTDAECADSNVTQVQSFGAPVTSAHDQSRYPELETMIRSWIKENSDTRKPVVIILRGIPGSGKSALGREARNLCSKLDAECTICSADLFFETPRGYVFDVKGLGRAHDMCKDNFTKAILSSLKRGDNASKKPWVVIVDNTNTQQWEYEPYQTIASKYDCPTHVLEMTCADASTAYRMGERNSHGVPPSKVVSMFLRWEHDPAAHSFTPQFGDSLLTVNPVTDNKVGGKLVYVGLFFDKVARAKLLSKVLPVHQNVVADHVTVFYKPPSQFMRTIDVGDDVMIRCVEVVQDEKGQAVRVELEETSSQPRIRNRVPHITISTAAGISSSYSNELLDSPSAKRTAVTDIALPAKVGYAMIVQNQRVITTRSPFAFGDLECRAINSDSQTTEIVVVHFNEADIVQLIQDDPSSGFAAQHRGRLNIRNALELLSLTCSTQNILVLQSDESTKSIPTAAMLGQVEKLLTVAGINTVVFSNLVRTQDPSCKALTDLLQSESTPVSKRITIFTTADVNPWTNLQSSNSVAVIGLSSSDAMSTRNETIQPQQRQKTLAKVLDTLRLAPQEHTLHGVLRVCQKLNAAVSHVVGGDIKAVSRIDATVLGLAASCVDVCVAMPTAVSSSETRRLRHLLATRLVESGVHCLESFQPGQFYVRACSTSPSSVLIRVKVICPDDSEVQRLKLCESLRERVSSICPDESVYAMLVALFAGLLRSYCECDCISLAFVNLAAEQIVCEYIQAHSTPPDFTIDDIVATLSQMLRYSTSWSESKWEEILAPVYLAFPNIAGQVSKDLLVEANRSLLDVVDKLVGGEEANSADVEEGLRKLLVRNAGVPRSEGVRAYVELPGEDSLGITSLRSLALSDALQTLASRDEINPARDPFRCDLSIVANRVNIITGSVELLHRVQQAFNEMSKEEGSKLPTAEFHVVFRLADTEVEI